MRAEGSLSWLHVEPVGGVAGDMLLAALLDLGADAGAIQAAYDSTGLRGLRLDISQVDLSGERACYVRSLGCTEGSGSAPCAAGQRVRHTHLRDILETVAKASMSSRARSRAEQIFTILARAEAEVHGGTPQTVHLHEVGDLDGILDVVGISVALDTLGNPEATCAPLPSGRGTVRTAHGELACPVPAVVAIASAHRIPLVPVPVTGETITPTGIAAVAAFCQQISARPVVAGIGARVGVGVGTRRFADRPNVVRIYGLEQAPPPWRTRGNRC